MTAQPPPEAYIRLSQTLPALKGVAIFMVVIFHLQGRTKGWLQASQILADIPGSGWKGMAEGLANLVCLLGEQGVHIFLIASGFGLAASWWRQCCASGTDERPFAAIPFWRRRLLRLFPLYWLAHGLALILLLVNPEWVPKRELLTQGGIDAVAALAASLTTLRNLVPEYYWFLNVAWWYIGLSIQLYLVFPLLVWVGRRWGWSVLLVGALLVSLGCRAILVSLPIDEAVLDMWLKGVLFPTRLFEFAFGIVLAVTLLSPNPAPPAERGARPAPNFRDLYRWSQRLAFERRWMVPHALLWVAGLVCHWSAASGWRFLRVPSDALLAVGEFCLLFQILSRLPGLRTRFSPVGECSYGIYLTHDNILMALWALFVPLLPFYWLRFAVVALATCLLGGLFELAHNWAQKNLLGKRTA
jgi:peptidoglycan/LPS O-acetylase OafA/YrhL